MIKSILGVLMTLASVSAMAVNVQIDTSDANNGLTNIYSATIDGGAGVSRSPCTGSSPPDSANCGFWSGGELRQGVAIALSPNPSGVINAVPGGITPAPASGSFLDIDLTGGNTTATLNGGVITFANLTLTIPGESGPTIINASGAGMEVVVGGSGTIGGDGIVQIIVEAPGSDLAADFSTFSDIVTDCTGSLCALVSLLGLDMERYILTLDYDASFTSFTGSFVGETNNNSLVYANLNSAPIPVPAAVWLFGSALGLLGWMRRRAA